MCYYFCLILLITLNRLYTHTDTYNTPTIETPVIESLRAVAPLHTDTKQCGPLKGS